MKKITLLIALFISVLAHGQKTYVPDDNFEIYLEANGMGDGMVNNDSVTTANISGVISLYVDWQDIANMTGIEDFAALDTLSCGNNQLTSLDVSSNTALQLLDCHNNQLTSLDVSSNTYLDELACNNNQLTSLDVSSNTFLRTLWCGNNQLTSLDVSQNILLSFFGCNNNQLTSLDVNNNINLIWLFCDNNQLTSFDVSQDTALQSLNCGNNQLTSLDVSHNTYSLTTLECDTNQLTSLDVSQNTYLEELACNNNQLISLNIANGNNNAIQRMYAQGNSNLQYICVDDAANTPPAGWDWQKDTTTSYKTCNAAPVPVSNWSVLLALGFIVGFVVVNYKRGALPV